MNQRTVDPDQKLLQRSPVHGIWEAERVQSILPRDPIRRRYFYHEHLLKAASQYPKESGSDVCFSSFEVIENVGGGEVTWIDLFRGRENVDVYVLESGRGAFFGSPVIYLHGETSARRLRGFLIVGHGLFSICDD